MASRLVKATVLAVALLSAAAFAGAWRGTAALASPGPSCMQNSTTGMISCADGFGHPMPVYPMQATMQPFAGCRIVPFGILLCPVGTIFLVRPAIVFQPTTLLLQPQIHLFQFRHCFVTRFRTVSCI